MNLDLKNTSLYCLACSCNSVRDKAHLSLSIISMTGLRDDAAPLTFFFGILFILLEQTNIGLVNCAFLAAQAGSPRSFSVRSLRPSLFRHSVSCVLQSYYVCTYSSRVCVSLCMCCHRTKCRLCMLVSRFVLLVCWGASFLSLKSAAAA